MDEYMRNLLSEMQKDPRRTGCIIATFGGTWVVTNDREFGKEDIDEGIRYLDAFNELIRGGYANWIGTKQECAQLIRNGLDWKPE